MDDDNICPICRDDLVTGKTKLSCSHYYHYKCILEYAGNNPSNKACPLCAVIIGSIPTQHSPSPAQPSPPRQKTNTFPENPPRQNHAPSPPRRHNPFRHETPRTETITNVQSSPRSNTQSSPRSNTQSSPRNGTQSIPKSVTQTRSANTSGPCIINDEDSIANSATPARSSGTSTNAPIRKTVSPHQKNVSHTSTYSQNNPSFLIFATAAENSGPRIIHSSDDESPIEFFTLQSRQGQNQYSNQMPSSHNNTSDPFTFGDMLSSLSHVPSNKPYIVHDSSDDD